MTLDQIIFFLMHIYTSVKVNIDGLLFSFTMLRDSQNAWEKDLYNDMGFKFPGRVVIEKIKSRK